MEWQGINLNGFREQQWLKQTEKNLWFLTACICISITSLAIISWHNQLLYQQDREIQKQVEQQKAHNAELIEKIEQLSLQHQNQTYETISSEQINAFVHYLKHIQLSGVIDTIHFYKNNQAILKIVGKLQDEKEIKILEDQIKASNHQYQIEHIQMNKNHQFEFSLLIYIK
ncbi:MULTISPECIES: hypothetical protein [Glaesserella]|uniref:Uncharacterized protein n=1 Tax=Glaesserella australis TaxID=2094024 RepID=A0A328C021_9PAST|nr:MULTISPECIES: hypothetical protein [Glaesserella]AUI66179.1 hypothetical protein CJD39_06115 [Glaesserella sp. 15-184]RAL19201.1 hypothetical protein C5N92_03540 [Glaesserella australis]